MSDGHDHPAGRLELVIVITEARLVPGTVAILDCSAAVARFPGLGTRVP